MSKTLDLLHVVDLLDRATNLFSNPINTDIRAHIFAAIERPTAETWQDARSSLITPDLTLWQAAIASGMAPYDVPTARDIISGLEWATEGH
jgi:hypothetical protein